MTPAVHLEAASPADMPLIEECVRRFRLDGENLQVSQFIVARREGQMVAFGRIKPYEQVFELGCVGVLEAERGRGLGRLVVEELIRRFPTPAVYLTTDLPEYFARLGFRRIDTGPPVLFAKIARVCSELRPGTVAMALIKPRFPPTP